MRLFVKSVFKSSVALAAIAILLAGTAGCQKKAAEGARAEARAVTVSIVQPRQIAGGMSASGNLIPREDTAIFPQVTGFRVARVLVDEGAWVKAGQPLAVLDDTLLRSQLAQQAALVTEQKVAADRADAEADRVKGLDADGILSKEQIDSRRFAAQSARAQVNAQVAALNDVKTRESLMTLRAPYAGLVIERNVRPGDNAAGTQPWFRMAKDGQIELAADLDEVSLNQLHPGDPARVTLADGQQVMGTVRIVSPGLDQSTKLGRVRITLPVRPDVRAGGFARAVFLNATHSAAAVPETALRYDGDGVSVLVVGPDSRLVRAAVTTGERGGGFVSLLTGPTPGVRVVAKAAAMMTPGDFVRPVLAP